MSGNDEDEVEKVVDDDGSLVDAYSEAIMWPGDMNSKGVLRVHLS